MPTQTDRSESPQCFLWCTDFNPLYENMLKGAAKWTEVRLQVLC